MAEVAVIINTRPLDPVAADPDDLFVLIPGTLLKQKVNIVPTPADEFVLQTSTSASGGKISTCPTPSGADGRNNSSQHYRNARSGSPFFQTSDQEVLFSRTAKYQEINGLLD